MSDKEFHFKGKVYAAVPDIPGVMSCTMCAFYKEKKCAPGWEFHAATNEYGLDCVYDEHHYVEKEVGDEV